MGHHLEHFGNYVCGCDLLESGPFLYVDHFHCLCDDVLERLQENQRNVTLNRRYDERHKDN